MIDRSRLTCRLDLLVSLVVALATRGGADEGMWPLNQLPHEALARQYGFEPTAEWVERVQKSAVNFGGASGSFISPDGLVLTNHHVGFDLVYDLSTPERDLVNEGYYAATPEQELKCPRAELTVLWSIEDVTGEVNAAAKPGMSAAEANRARNQRIAEIESDAEKRTGLMCEVVRLYRGGFYHLYCNQRFTDVRLVWAPESRAAYFGGDPDNFEYPRHALDACIFRVYENDRPYKPAHFLRWSERGAADGELVFVAGHPGRTQRILTVDHLRFLRDVQYPETLGRLWRREVQLYNFSDRSAEFRRIAEADYFGVQNGRKAYTGYLAGLHDPGVFGGKIEAERSLRAVVDGNPEYKAKWGDAWDQLSAALANYRGFYLRHALLEQRFGTGGSQLFDFARKLVRLAAEKQKPNSERLPAYQDAALASLEQMLYSPAPIYDALEIDALSSSLSLLAERFGAEDPTVVRLLAARSPRARAEELVRGTTLRDVEARRKVAAGGQAAIDASSDPLIRLAADVDAEARGLHKRCEDEFESVERDAYARIAAAQFAIRGTKIAPDATGTLRLSYGVVKGYRENGAEVLPFTTIGGMFEKSRVREGKPPYDLPKRFAARQDAIDRSTPFNFVCTPDIIGGNSGSPVLNRAGEVVGLIFDGNLQSLVWGTAYTDEQGRSIAVDSRAILEALRNIYGAGKLADEITGAKPRDP